MPANLENSAVATGLEKVSFHSNPKETQCKRMSKNYRTIALISHASKVMLKILQARLQQFMNQMFRLDLEKAEEPEIKLNKQGDNVQPFLIYNQSVVPCPVLTVAS